jgi:hypothetical protein
MPRFDTLADVAQDDREQRAALLAVLRDRGFDREFLAVGAQAGQHGSAARPLRGRARATEALDMLAVLIAEPFREELVDGLPDDRVARPAEDLLGRGIEQDDPLGRVDRDDRIHRGFYDVGDARGDVLQRAGRRLPL